MQTRRCRLCYPQCWAPSSATIRQWRAARAARRRHTTALVRRSGRARTNRVARHRRRHAVNTVASVVARNDHNVRRIWLRVVRRLARRRLANNKRQRHGHDDHVHQSGRTDLWLVSRVRPISWPDLRRKNRHRTAQCRHTLCNTTNFYHTGTPHTTRRHHATTNCKRSQLNR